MVTSHFAATPQNDVVRICAHDFQRHGDAFGTTESGCFRAFITLRSQFHLYHCSQRTLTEIVSKITPKPRACPLSIPENTADIVIYRALQTNQTRIAGQQARTRTSRHRTHTQRLQQQAYTTPTMHTSIHTRSMRTQRTHTNPTHTYTPQNTHAH